ncbi:hypothetical protein HK102_006052 [Quaeritorhiza haematococci]|nr:hypothetical protein HK102_006052 [Quaeritorhiza haematococci]
MAPLLRSLPLLLLLPFIHSVTAQQATATAAAPAPTSTAVFRPAPRPGGSNSTTTNTTVPTSGPPPARGQGNSTIIVNGTSCGAPNQWTEIATPEQLPRLANCTTLLGSLLIRGPLKDLTAGLSRLQTIELSLDITETDLQDLTGLTSLREIGDKFFIHANKELRSLEGMGNLTRVGNGLFVYDSPTLVNIRGLRNLQAVNPDINPALPFGVSIYNNPRLSSLSGLESLRSFGHIFLVADCPSLRDLRGIPTPQGTGIEARNITLRRNINMTDISQLSIFNSPPASTPGVTGTNLEVLDMLLLSRLDGLSGLTRIGNLIIKSNSALVNVDAIAKASINGPVVDINDNGRLCEFSGVNVTAAKVPDAIVVNACGFGKGANSFGSPFGSAGARSADGAVMPVVVATVMSMFAIWTF